MKVKALFQHLDRIGTRAEDQDVVIEVGLWYASVGGTPHVHTETAFSGIDWDASRFIIRPTTKLVPAKDVAAWQMRRKNDNWRDKTTHPWEPCSFEQAQQIITSHGSRYEARALYAGPLP